MMRDAALLTLDLVEELSAHGLTLKDSHPWNILFDGANPIDIDLTSIAPLGEGEAWMGNSSFCRNFLHPLILISHG